MALVGREREVAAVTDLPYRDAEAARLSRSLGGFLIGIAILLTWADMLGIPMLPVHSHG